MQVPEGNPLFELQQTIYSSSNYTRRRLHQDRLAWVNRAIEIYAPLGLGLRAIEYGPGSGVYLPRLAEHCATVVVADVEAAYLAGIEPLVACSPNLSVVVDDIQCSGFADGSFELVLCSEVLEHVANPERALETIYRILQPGGIAIVTTPQRYSLMELSCRVAFLPGVLRLVRWIYGEPVLETGHISLRSARQFRQTLGRCGFVPVEQDRFGLYLPMLAEFGGDAGGRMIESVEEKLRGRFLAWALWTQAYVLKRPS
jgi:SAM-dependent methyltransferase